jgi:hypothetical protein
MFFLIYCIGSVLSNLSIYPSIHNRISCEKSKQVSEELIMCYTQLCRRRRNVTGDEGQDHAQESVHRVSQRVDLSAIDDVHDRR